VKISFSVRNVSRDWLHIVFIDITELWWQQRAYGSRDFLIEITFHHVSSEQILVCYWLVFIGFGLPTLLACASFRRGYFFYYMLAHLKNNGLFIVHAVSLDFQEGRLGFIVHALVLSATGQESRSTSNSSRFQRGFCDNHANIVSMETSAPGGVAAPKILPKDFL
jgi:hypothetical protein